MVYICHPDEGHCRVFYLLEVQQPHGMRRIYQTGRMSPLLGHACTTLYQPVLGPVFPRYRLDTSNIISLADGRLEVARHDLDVRCDCLNSLAV
jgi:hypothetical protein